MSTKRIHVIDTFEQSTCSICGVSEINQYFRINDSFIEWNGTFYSIREILVEALDFHINHDEGSQMEICLECKDKSIKFYHFKRRAKEIHKQNLKSNRPKPLLKEKQSKVVQDIVRIVEEYSERCTIASIKIEEREQKLVIQSSEAPVVNLVHLPISLHQKPEVKQEPVLSIEENSYHEDDSISYKNASESESLQLYDSSEPGTSTSTMKNLLRGKSLEHVEEHESEKLKMRRRRRMELLRLPNNHDLYERHKAQARERTRRYREKMRQQKMIAEAKKRIMAGMSQQRSQSPEEQHTSTTSNGNFPSYFPFAQVKLEEASDSEDVVFT